MHWVSEKVVNRAGRIGLEIKTNPTITTGSTYLFFNSEPKMVF